MGQNLHDSVKEIIGGGSRGRVPKIFSGGMSPLTSEEEKLERKIKKRKENKNLHRQ